MQTKNIIFYINKQGNLNKSLKDSDVSTMELESTCDTGLKFAQSIEHPSPPLAMFVNGILRDLNFKIKSQDKIEFIYFDSLEGKALFWHSSAHILAQAIKRLYPQAKPSIGPPIEQGFFYDFGDIQVSEDDFPTIEKEIKKIINENYQPHRIEYKNEKEAKEAFYDNPYKQEIIEKSEETLSAYQQGEFIDLCTGPHLPSFQFN